MTLPTIPDVKTLREALCVAEYTVADLIRMCDRLRPLGSDGKHGDRHTPYCGCDDALAVASLPAAPVVLPDREAIAQTIRDTSRRDEGTISATGAGRVADAVLALLAETVTPWKPVDPGDIKPGMRVRWKRIGSDAEGAFTVAAVAEDRFFFDGGYSLQSTPYTWEVDPRTVPADPADPDADLVEAMARASWAVSNPEYDWDDDIDAPEREDYLADARTMLAAIRETHTIEPKPVTGPLGGAR